MDATKLIWGMSVACFVACSIIVDYHENGDAGLGMVVLLYIGIVGAVLFLWLQRSRSVLSLAIAILLTMSLAMNAIVIAMLYAQEQVWKPIHGYLGEPILKTAMLLSIWMLLAATVAVLFRQIQKRSQAPVIRNA